LNVVIRWNRALRSEDIVQGLSSIGNWIGRFNSCIICIIDLFLLFSMKPHVSHVLFSALFLLLAGSVMDPCNFNKINAKIHFAIWKNCFSWEKLVERDLRLITEQSLQTVKNIWNYLMFRASLCGLKHAGKMGRVNVGNVVHNRKVYLWISAQ
jgi:hypothetical protein